MRTDTRVRLIIGSFCAVFVCALAFYFMVRDSDQEADTAKHDKSQAEAKADTATNALDETTEAIEPVVDRVLTLCLAGGKSAAELRSIGLCDRAKDAADTIDDVTPVPGPAGATGSTGPRGATGRPPTVSEVRAAVVAYCATGRCDGSGPTQAQVVAAVDAYCAAGECRGAAGRPGLDSTVPGPKGDTGQAGKDGKDASAEMVDAAVSRYCSDGKCVGPQGPAGADGADGATGPQGLPGPVCPDGYSGMVLTVVTPGDPPTRDIFACVPNPPPS